MEQLTNKTNIVALNLYKKGHGIPIMIKNSLLTLHRNKLYKINDIDRVVPSKIYEAEAFQE